MAKSTEQFTFSVRIYEEPLWGLTYLGPNRYSLNMGRLSLIFEFWYVRGGLRSS